MSVNTQHPEYAKHYPKWVMMKDALNDEVIKKGTVYLSKTPGMLALDREGLDPEQNVYCGYKSRAQYPLWVSDSVRTMNGLLTRLKPEVNLVHKQLEILKTQATNDGFGVDQLFIRCCIEALAKGRYGLLVDFDDKGQPYISMYDSLSIINWKSGDVGGRRDAKLIVLQESHLKAEQSKYGHESEVLYRELELADNQYEVRLLTESGKEVESFEPKMGAKRLNFIPFVFGGSLDNSPEIGDIPLYSMAKCAVKYYQLSADYYQSLYLTAHPQPYTIGADNVDLKVSGPMMLWVLPPGASCGFMEIQGNGIEKTKAEMDSQKNAAVEAGAKVLDAGSNESGEARKARQNDQHASLHTVVKAAAEAIEQACKYAALWLGLDDSEIRFTVPLEFAQDIDPQILAQLSNLMMAGKISSDTVWTYLQTGKIPERDKEAEDDLIEEDSAKVPMGGNIPTE
ncbi:DUF4055 domain-containing protein [Acinetobacter sp. YH12073]|uniref:DUF4055 domain-containing protein n=1 Tax=Acinetobacter sp. YH12073 TaxID=2601069 RepID=UPI0015D41DA8|nr:DUF4055 domain-containing protein [Acinetobacter sp. YH12073]